MMEQMVRLKKEDCGKAMTGDESRRVQLEMLDALASFCDKNGLRYFLSGGTLLGAVRHKGFIPWDDDVDVNMPRPDCEKLMRLTGGTLGKLCIAGPDEDCFSLGCESYRIYDFNTVMESTSGGIATEHPIYYPIFIDIFPIEGLPDGRLATKLHYMRIIFLRKMQRSAGLEHMMGSNMAAHIFHVLSRIPAKLVGYKRWSRAIQRTAAKYAFDSHQYVGVMTAPVHTTEEKVVKDDYMDPVEVEFEGKHYHAPANYDTYLTQLYGDYMKLPPKEKQQSHHDFNTYWRNATADRGGV